MPRDLTKAEERAVDRLEKALAAIPDSLALYFESEGSVYVFDRKVWEKGPDGSWGIWVQDESSDARTIACRFDVGAL